MKTVVILLPNSNFPLKLKMNGLIFCDLIQFTLNNNELGNSITVVFGQAITKVSFSIFYWVFLMKWKCFSFLFVINPKELI